MGVEERIRDLNIDGIMNSLLIEAKKQRSEIPYSRDEEFPIMVFVLGPNLEFATVPMQWSNNKEKYLKMKAVSQVAKEMFAHAVGLITDTRWTNSREFCAHFNIPSPEEIGVERYSERYNEILHKPPYNGEVKNLPRALWHEAIMVVMKGPTIGTHTLQARYIEGPRDSIQWLQPEEGQTLRTDSFRLLPDWWE